LIFIQDVSPTWSNTDVSQDGQSVTGRMLSLAVSTDRQTLYTGSYSNVWKSTDGGQNFGQLTRPQPLPGTFGVPGALGGWAAFDVAVSPRDSNNVLALTRYDLRSNDHGLYRSTDGGATWTMVHQFPGNPTTAGQIVWAQDDPTLVYVAGSTSVAISKNSGATFTDVFPWGTGSGAANHIAIGPGIPSAANRRLVYALGKSQMWISNDAGATWTLDGSPNVPPSSGGAATSALGNAPSVLVVHPGHALTVFLITDNSQLWTADYSFFQNGQGAFWRQLPTPKFGSDEPDSGNNFIAITRDPKSPLLYYCGQSRLYVAPTPPDTASEWHRLDNDHSVHVDLHGVFLSHDFTASIDNGSYHFHTGTLWLLSDGGLDRSTDGGAHFHHPNGLSTLSAVNISGVAQSGKTALCLNTGDNYGFFSGDGGSSWSTHDYKGGDNDCAYADPLQSDRMIVYTPRNGDDGSVTLYKGSNGHLPNEGDGTGDGNQITAPPKGTGQSHWNAVSNFALRDSRPVVQTLRGQDAKDQGDYVFIRYKTDTEAVLLRTQSLLDIDTPNDWDTLALSEFVGARVWQVGPSLPSATIETVQASGGHVSPVFYVGGQNIKALWRWTSGMANWKQLVPSSDPAGPQIAFRYFVDPYRPNIIFLLDAANVLRSEDGGETWVVDTSLEQQLTSDHAIPITQVENSSEADKYIDTLLNDMQFDPDDALTRFAVGCGGAFFTVDGINWNRLYDTGALASRPTSCYYDAFSNPCRRALYVGLSGRGILKLTQLPWGSLQPPDPDDWSTNVKIGSQHTKAPVALAVFNGLIHMVHLDNSSNNIWWSTSPDGINWTPDVKIGSQLSKTSPALAVFNNQLFMVHSDNSSNDLWIATCDGTSWTNDTKIPQQKSKSGAALATYNGKLHMVHLDDSSNDIWWSQFDGTSWKTSSGGANDQKISGQLSKSQPSLAVFGNELHMIHLGDNENDVWWSAFDGTGWWPNTRIRCQKSQATPALCAQGGLLHLMHMGDSSHDIWWSVYDGTRWTPDQTIPDQLSKAKAALCPTPDGSRLVMVHLGDSENDLWLSLL
jgi:hypothetical protein